MKRIVLAIYGFLTLATAQGASFDCAKARSKVEHLICETSEISKLDEDLAASYKSALQDPATAKLVKRTQELWLNKRNVCSNAECVGDAYKLRLVHLNWEAKGIFAMPEQVRGEIASGILNGSKVVLRAAGPYDQSDTEFCNSFVKDFAHQHGIEYVEPELKTNDYNHPVLTTLRNQCPNIKWEWMAPKKCNVDDLALWLKGYETNSNDAHQKAEQMCTQLFGLDELAIYEVEYGGHKEHIIYQSRTPKLVSDELDKLLRIPTKKDLWADEGAWNRRTNTVMNVFFTGAGYSAYDFSQCKTGTIGNIFAGGVTSPDTLQGLVKYGGKYYVYNLMYNEREERKQLRAQGIELGDYNLIVGGRNPICHFDVYLPKY